MAFKVAITGIVGVFIGLAILCLLLIIIQKFVSYLSEKKEIIPQKTSIPAVNTKKKQELSGEVIAALAASIYLDLRSFDEKKKLLTIQQVTKPYAPWVNSGKVMMISDNNLFNSRKMNG